jgi:hypothetical protein
VAAVIIFERAQDRHRVALGAGFSSLDRSSKRSNLARASCLGSTVPAFFADLSLPSH